MLRQVVTLLLCLPAVAIAAEPPIFVPEQLEFFEKEVRPLLIVRCHKCHGATEQKGNLRLDSRVAVLAGGDSGPAVTLAQPETSELLRAISYDPDGYQMPPDGKLPAAEIEVLTRWVAQGAPWPAESADAANPAASWEEEFARRMQHWSFQPVARPRIPTVAGADWCRTPIDRFVAVQREAAGLSHAEEADRRTWLRRVWFDVIGLPPSPEEVEAFVRDDAPDAHERVIDRLLSSPHFGERWGRHWLDLVRYAESRGHEFDYDVANPWPYRDYVVRAINGDVPYDRFVVEHVAGDLLGDESGGTRDERPLMPTPSSIDNRPSTIPPLRLDPATGANESIVATGFWFLGEWVHSPVDIRQDEADRFENMLDVYSKTFLGLTVACARCHDHKFDPIPQTDFYALQGYLQSSSYRQVRYESIEHNRRTAEAIRELQRRATPEITGVMDEIAGPVLERLDEYLLAARHGLVAGTDASSSDLQRLADQRRLSPVVLRAWVQFLRTSGPQEPSPLWRLFADPRPIDFAVLQDHAPANTRAGTGDSTDTAGAPPQQAVELMGRDLIADGEGFLRGSETQHDLVVLSNDPAAPIQSLVATDSIAWDANWPEPDNRSSTPDAGAISDWNRAGRIVRTPTFEITHDQVFCEVSGRVNSYVSVDSHILIKGPLHGTLVQSHADQAGRRWIRHDVSRYRGHRAHVELSPSPGSSAGFTVHRIVHAARTPKECFDRVDAAGVTNEAQLAHTLAQSYENPSLRWAEYAVRPELFGLTTPEVRDRIAAVARPFVEENQSLCSRIRRESHTAPAMCEGSGEDEYLFIRGNWKKRGETVPRRFLTAFASPQPADAFGGSTNGAEPSTPNSQPSIPTGSGRLALAEQMVDPQQTPIVARVVVNRIWQHYFGRGIVPTPDDFGHLGLPPSHPELLDWLATELVAHDWSLKHIHRLILTSATYRMAGEARGMSAEGREGGTAEETEKQGSLRRTVHDASDPPSASSLTPHPSPLTTDPNNTLLWRMNVKRLEGEIIRDAMLALSGRLDDELYGPSVPVHLTPFMEGRGRPGESGPVDGRGRRSLYIAVRRNFPDPFFQAFDFPNPHTTIGRRNVSNVPAQALALLNNPLVLDQSRTAAQRLLAETPDATLELRLERLSASVFGRPPTEAERTAGVDFITTLAGERGCTTADPRIWADYVHALLNTKEFVFVR